MAADWSMATALANESLFAWFLSACLHFEAYKTLFMTHVPVLTVAVYLADPGVEVDEDL